MESVAMARKSQSLCMRPLLYAVTTASSPRCSLPLPKCSHQCLEEGGHCMG